MEDYFRIQSRLNKKKKDLIEFSVKNLHGPNKIELSRADVIVLCLVKNGEPLIQDFISHYFRLGVRHIVFLDNGSSDKTIELAKGYKNITILQTNFPFEKGNNMRLREYLIERFAKNKWSLCVDIDEFFDYPFSDIVSLKELIMYLNKNNYTALVTQMLDRFPRNISRFKEKEGDIREHRYYDLFNITKKEYFLKEGRISNSNIKIYSGGIRKKLFNVKPFLTKHALIFCNKNTKRNRLGHRIDKGRVADFSAVLHHFKFLNNFFKQVKNAVKEKQYAQDSKEYEGYYKISRKVPVLEFLHENAREFTNVNELVNNGFLVVSKKYLQMVDKKEGGLVEGSQIKSRDLLENSKESVSVVIACKNKSGLRLDNCLKSLKNQDYNKRLIEVIVVDYGSDTTHSLEIKKLCEKYNFRCIDIRRVSIWNKSRALNIGIKNSNSKYILISDVDVVFAKNYISECVREINRDKFQVLYNKSLDFPADKDINDFDVIKDFEEIKNLCSERKGDLNDSKFRFGCGICFALGYFFKSIRGYDENYILWGAEDADIIKRFESLGLGIKEMSYRTFYVHQWHPKFESFKEMKYFIQIHKENRKYLLSNNSILRNLSGWGGEREIEFSGKGSVSVIVPWRDIGINRLSNCLKSLKNQDYDKRLIEVIVVDYGSKRNNSVKVKNLCKKYKVRYLKVDGTSHWNRARALNIGIRNSISEYVLVSDIDIIFAKNYIGECVKEIKRNKFRVLYCHMMDSLESEKFNEGDYFKIKEKCKYRLARQHGYKQGISICFSMRCFFDLIRGYDEFYNLWGSEDTDLIKRFELIGLRLKEITHKTFHIHQWHEMHSGVKNTAGFEEQIKKNREHFFKSSSLLRNLGGWGEIKYNKKSKKSRKRSDVAVVSCYFNPCYYKNRLKNYRIFREGIIRTGVRFLTVELAFGEDDFELSEFPEVMQLRTSKKNIMWQKERLLNIGIQKLIAEGYEKIAWLDADIVFEDDEWIKDLSRVLDNYMVCQVFKEVYHERWDTIIPSGIKYFIEEGEFFPEGSGFGWAARAELLKKVLLYDYSILGGADCLIYYANYYTPEFSKKIEKRPLFTKELNLALQIHFFQWAKKWSRIVKGNVGFLNQKIRALYHGSRKARSYVERNAIYRKYDFDPKKDIRVGENKCFEWVINKPGLCKEVKDYFYFRREDD